LDSLLLFGMIAALPIQTNIIIMKKILLMAIVAAFSYLGANAQTAPGNSAYGHSHKKIHKHYHVTNNTASNRRAINVTHRTTIKAVTSNDALSNQQQRDQIKQANVSHKQEMKAVGKGKK
jgi:hypothetical protein